MSSATYSSKTLLSNCNCVIILLDMSDYEKVTLYTVPGLYAKRYTLQSYREIVALLHNDNLIRIDTKHQRYAEAESFVLPPKFAGCLSAYFAKYYDECPTRERNCHIGAAEMTIPRLRNSSWIETYGMAVDLVKQGRITDRLKVGQRGVIGEIIPDKPEYLYDGLYDDEEALPYEPGPEAHHSVVGLAPELCIQTDSTRGPFSIASLAETIRLYRERIGRVNVKLYA